MLAGLRLALSVGLAVVRAAGRRGHQGGGGVRLEGAGRAGDRAGGPLLIGQADTAQAGQIGQVVTVGGAGLPGADRGGGGADRGGQRAEEKPGRAAQAVHSGFFVSAADRGVGGSFPVLIGAGAVWHWFRLHLIHPHGSRWHRSRAAQFRRRMIRQNAAGRRGQILHLTAYRPIGNGELGSMPPYYPPLAPFFPGFGVVFRPLVPLLLHSGIEGIKYIILQTFSAGNSCGADCCAFAPFRANRDTVPVCVIFIACLFVCF